MTIDKKMLMEFFRKNILKIFFIEMVSLIILFLFAVRILWYPNLSTTDVHTNRGMGIKDLLSRVKSELYEAEKERIDKQELPLFELKDFDLEINFVVQKSSKIGGGVVLHVIEVDSEIQTGSERIQKIKLHMTAIPPQIYEQEPSKSPIPVEPKDSTIHGPVPPEKSKKGEKP